ncbi:hypothetical protein, partial [Pseudomonas mandelii]|uniref:hypothetical protein n=1 Tax=Pseudomonas mandelii TaxID=75612 RepID=UPI003D005271
MAYSYTEKKRIRKDFSKLPDVMDVPYLLALAQIRRRPSGVDERRAGADSC